MPNLDAALKVRNVGIQPDNVYKSTSAVDMEKYILTVTVAAVAGSENILHDLLTAPG